MEQVSEGEVSRIRIHWPLNTHSMDYDRLTTGHGAVLDFASVSINVGGSATHRNQICFLTSRVLAESSLSYSRNSNT